MMEWFIKFWQAHGERFIFGGLAEVFAIFFLFQESPELNGAGLTIQIGLAMLCFNKARGVKGDAENKP